MTDNQSTDPGFPDLGSLLGPLAVAATATAVGVALMWKNESDMKFQHIREISIRSREAQIRRDRYQEEQIRILKSKVRESSTTSGSGIIMVDVFNPEGSTTRIQFDETQTKTPTVVATSPTTPLLVSDVTANGFTITPQRIDMHRQVLVASSNDVGAASSLRMINGMPACAFWDRTNGALRFARAKDNKGESWDSSILVDAGQLLQWDNVATSNVGSGCVLLEVSDNASVTYPAIVYLDSDNLQVKYIRALNSNGSEWPLAPTIINTNSTETVHLPDAFHAAVIGGYPVVAYQAISSDGISKVCYARASAKDGSVSILTPATTNSSQSALPQPAITTPFGVVRIIDNPDTTGATYLQFPGFNMKLTEYTDLTTQVVRPVVVYNFTNTDDADSIRMVVGSDVDFTSIQIKTMISDIGENCYEMRIHQLTDGRLGVSYLTSNRTLRFRYSLATQIDSFSAAIDIAGSSGSNNSDFNIINGRPCLTYHDYIHGQQKYVASKNLMGTEWYNPVILDSSGIVGRAPSLNDIGGRAALTYYDEGLGNLKYARSINQRVEYTFVAV